MDSNSQTKKLSVLIKSIVIFILIFIAVSLFATWWDNNQGVIIDDQGFTQYLNEKYGQEFVVENVRESGTGFAVKGSWRGEAYPKSDPTLKFRIDRSQTTDKISVDMFLQELWTRQGTPEVEDFLNRELPNHESFHLTISAGNNPGGKFYDSIQGETPSLEDALSREGNAVEYTLSVRGVASPEEDKPSREQLNNALKVVNFVKAKNTLPAAYAYYNYRYPSFDKHDDAGQQKYQYGFHIERNELLKVNNADDLKNYFKVLN